MMQGHRRLVAIMVLALAPIAAGAQGLGVIQPGSDAPLEIESDDGIEWREREQVYIASGNVRAAQGDVALYSDRLTAHYRKSATGKTEVHRLIADGNVRIASSSETAYADKGVYDVDQGLLLLTGKELRLDTPDTVITARDSLEYYDKKKYAVARGKALLVHDGKRLKAEVLVAYMREDAQGKTSIRLVRAYDDVLLSTGTEIVQSRRAEYNLDTGIATLLGAVRLTRGENQLNGDRAVINVRTGVSRLLRNPSQGSAVQVHGLFIPDKGNLAYKGDEREK